MRHTILIVDDDAALVEIMTVFLRSEDYEIFAADECDCRNELNSGRNILGIDHRLFARFARSGSRESISEEESVRSDYLLHGPGLRRHFRNGNESRRERGIVQACRTGEDCFSTAPTARENSLDAIRLDSYGSVRVPTAAFSCSTASM